MILSLDVARHIARRVHLEAASLGLRPLTVVVLDSGGHVVVAERADACPHGLFDIARGKAYGALALGMDSRRIMERAEVQPHFVASATAALAGRLIPVPGGVPYAMATRTSSAPSACPVMPRTTMSSSDPCCCRRGAVHRCDLTTAHD